ncbi:MAG: deoxyribose-phosphate aldolase [Selenomonadaceae bacterium]|nr:deoxyribose-phosphate aldolase [Selenomonadaceae bacterium]MBR6906495.1 deoxyribose-phosphate aldolase [Selenomonadaceae bacterium]
MDAKEILSHVDHTLLKQTATWEEIQQVCEEAIRYHTATAMVPSAFIPRIRAKYGTKLKIATVVGFPNGNCSTTAKLAETAQALVDGAEEIDMVLQIGELKAWKLDIVTEEIRALKVLCGQRILKVIVETCLLTEREKIAACRCVTEGGADYIKTSTGFGTGGATLEDIALFRDHIGPNVKMKAAGGIRTREDMEAFLAAGCERLGASAAVKLLKDEWDG